MIKGYQMISEVIKQDLEKGWLLSWFPTHFSLQLSLEWCPKFFFDTKWCPKLNLCKFMVRGKWETMNRFQCQTFYFFQLNASICITCKNLQFQVSLAKNEFVWLHLTTAKRTLIIKSSSLGITNSAWFVCRVVRHRFINKL